MKDQNYHNHSRYYVWHHFVFYPVAFVFLVISLCCSFSSEEPLLWIMMAVLICLLAGVSLMMRQHYALGNQNRIVRLELRLRYYVLTSKRFEEIENKLSLSQVFALRFASDEELVGLVDRAVKENLSGDEIKRSIKNWLPDHMRV